mmetsp:Transcript_52628/g.104467  ORF Transcript_52628/g.104467 Transcript_52628/m.104467 type:complete len:772 (+) Transcript_52628:49-2364(+)
MAFIYAAAGFLVLAAFVDAVPVKVATSDSPRSQPALLQSRSTGLDSNGAKSQSQETPVTRVVQLLKAMQLTLQSEMAEDEALYKKLACWCSTNEKEKKSAISDGGGKVAELTTSIEALTAKIAQLEADVKQLEEETAEEKKKLAEATAIREKEAAQFHSEELDSIQSIETLKAAIIVLSKHHGGALPQLSFSLLEVRGQREAAANPWSGDHDSAALRSFDDFLANNGFSMAGSTADASAVHAVPSRRQRFLQEAGGSKGASNGADSAASEEWSAAETTAVQRAMKVASRYMRARHREEYDASYAPRSGEILGVLKELKSQMEADLGDEQKAESAKAATFAEMRKAKSAEIAAAEKQAEQKEDEFAKASMDLAESKEDLENTQAALTEDEKFMANLKTTCEDADKNFEARKASRMAEITAVSEAMSILTSDEARDTISRTYNLLQVVATHSVASIRSRASVVLRKVAAKAGIPDLSILATRVELDSFARVKKALDDMVAILKQEQADEVKKHDWCTSEGQKNDMAIARAEEEKTALTAKVDDMDTTLARLLDEIAQAKKRIGSLELELQRAGENRQKENVDFQQTVVDQRSTQDILKDTLDRLAKFYENEEFLQKSVHKPAASTLQIKSKQTPPVPQMKYKKNAGAGGVMSLLRKLITDANQLEKDALRSENEAQAQYETFVADTNDSIRALSDEIAEKTSTQALTNKAKAASQEDLAGAGRELEELGRYQADLSAECGFLLKNFDARQEARGQEIEALLQAKQILSGASLS